MNILEKLQNKIPDFSQIDYSGVRCNMSDDPNFNQSFNMKSTDIFVKNSINIEFIEKYAENTTNQNKGHKNTKNAELDQSNMMNFLQIVQGKEPINIPNKIRNDYIGILINSTAFNLFITIVIIVNTILICLQTNEKIYNKNPIVFQSIDSLCVIVFTIELILRFIYNPKEFWFSGWNIFDLIIVLISYISSSFTFVTSFRVLRIFKVLKAFRILKSLKSAKKMSIMFQALIKSSKDIGFIILLIILFLLCSSLIALTLFSSYSDIWFGSFTRTLWTLVIFLTADGWLDPYNDLVDVGQRFVAMIFIFIFIWVGAWILTNSLVGVATNSIKSAKKEMKEEENEIKKEKKDEEKANQNQLKKLQAPPFNADRSWDQQVPLEIPRLNDINHDALIHLYLTLSVINQNVNELDDLIDKYQQSVSEIISKSIEDETTTNE